MREIRDRVEIDRSDVRDADAMDRLVEGCDVVYHLAAQVSHVMSLSNPYPDIDINIKGTAVVLEACRRKNPEAIVVRSGTRGQYGPAVRLPVSEETPSDPRGIYEISQLSSEMICRTYTRIHGVRTVPLRLTNVYGPQGADAPLPVRRRELVRPARPRGPADPDLRHRPDPARLPLRGRLRRRARRRGARAVARSARSSTSGTTGRRPSSRSPRSCGSSSPERRSSSPSSRRSGGPRSRATSSPTSRRSARLIGWEPRVGLREGLARTVEFYRERRADYF